MKPSPHRSADYFRRRLFILTVNRGILSRVDVIFQFAGKFCKKEIIAPRSSRSPGGEGQVVPGGIRVWNILTIPGPKHAKLFG